MGVNALSGQYLISTNWVKKSNPEGGTCQCPLGLVPHFYTTMLDCIMSNTDIVSMPSRASTSFLQGKHLLHVSCYDKSVNALSGQYLISTEIPAGVVRSIITVSMPSRASTSFLQYPFKNLGFMRFPEPVFAGIYQNILTTAVFHAC